MGFVLTSPLFASGQMIPDRFLARGEGLSPPLVWRGAPAGARSFALMAEDTDTGTVLWAACDIAGTRLPEGAGNAGPDGGPLVQAVNDVGIPGYAPPDPGEGEGVHTVCFRLAALPVRSLGLGPGTSARALWAAAHARALEEVDLLAFVTGLPPDG